MEVTIVPMLTSSTGVGAILVVLIPFMWFGVQLFIYLYFTFKFGWHGFIVSLMTAFAFNFPVWYLTH